MILSLDIAQPKTTDLQFYDNTPEGEDKDGYGDTGNPAKADITFWCIGLKYIGPDAAWNDYVFLSGTSVMPEGVKEAFMDDFGGSDGAKFPDGWYDIKYIVASGSAITSGSLTNEAEYVCTEDTVILNGVTPTNYVKGDVFTAGVSTVVDSGEVYLKRGSLDDSMLLLGQINGNYLYYLATMENKDTMAKARFKELYRDLRMAVDAAKALHLTDSYTNCAKRIIEAQDIIVSIKSLC